MFRIVNKLLVERRGTMDLTTIIVAIIGSGVLNTLLSHFITQQEKKKDYEGGVKEALRLIMKDRLRFLCMHYVQQGWIYEDELEDITSMHQCYHNDLNGNGFLDKQMDRVNNLEIKGTGAK